MRIAFPLAMAGALLLMASLARAEVPVLVLNDPNAAPLTTVDGQGFLDAVAGEAFRRAGVELKLVRLPAERGLLNANAGIEDGDLSRIAGLEAQYPNLVRVPEKLLDIEFTAFSKNPALPGRLEVLRTHPAGYIKGWKIFEKLFAGAPNVVTAGDPEQMFRQLELDRIDVALYAHWQGLSLIRHQGLKGVHALEPPLAKRELFIYLHNRHAALVPKLAEALREIKAEGLYDRLYREKVLPLSVSAAK